MKNTVKFIAAALLCISGSSLRAQDIITLRNGEDLKTTIAEIRDGEIRYRDFGNPDGPLLTISQADILMITYQNGTREVISHVSADNASAYNGGMGIYSGSFSPNARLYATSPELLRPNMGYKELKQIYSLYSYDGHMTGDPYSAQCYLSIIMPGLGQMAMGEPGRGGLFLGAEIGCYALTFAGYLTMLLTSITEDHRMGTPAPQGVAMVIIGSFGVAGTYIWSIVDAVNMMKIKNMYARDMSSAASGVYFSLSPWAAPVSVGTNSGCKTAAGLSLSMRF